MDTSTPKKISMKASLAAHEGTTKNSHYPAVWNHPIGGAWNHHHRWIAQHRNGY